MAKGDRGQTDCRTDPVPKGEKLKPKRDTLLGRRDETSKREVEGASWCGRGEPLPQILKIAALIKHYVSGHVPNASRVES